MPIPNATTARPAATRDLTATRDPAATRDLTATRDRAATRRDPPPSRNRYVDFLRAASLLVVVFGHWLLAVVTYTGPDTADLRGDNLLAIVPATQWLTLLLQVMPVFFLVGGYAHAASLRSATRRGVGYATWLRSRAVRLLRPVAVLLAVWVPLTLVLHAAGLDPAMIRVAAFQVVVPLWFLAVYLAVVTLAPAMLAAHRRLGAAVPLVLAAGAAVVDVAVYAAGLDWLGWANFGFVWLFAHQLGFLWFDGTLTRGRGTRWLLAAGGALTLLALVFAAGYPLSMVGADNGGRSNNLPPSLALVALGVWQTGLVLLCEPRLRRWLQRPRVWAGVVAANLSAMTLYLWHLTALIVVVLGVYVTRLWPDVPAAGTAWWALRPLWLLLLVVAVTPLVILFGRLERAAAGAARSERPGRRHPAVAVAATVASSLAIALLVRGGLYHSSWPTLLPVAPLMLLTAGMLALGVLPLPARVKYRQRHGAAHDGQ